MLSGSAVGRGGSETRGAHCTSDSSMLREMTSPGRSRKEGPGVPCSDLRTASAIYIGRRSVVCARVANFAYGRTGVSRSASWKSPIPTLVVSPAPPSMSSGQRLAQALANAAVAFSAPGPETSNDAPTRPVRYEVACAA